MNNINENSVEDGLQGVIVCDSIISLTLVTDSRDKRYNYNLMRSESLEGNIIFRRCNTVSDVGFVKESLFLIDSKRETTSDGLLVEEEQEKKYENIIYNGLFTLQHYLSKKFLVAHKNNSNNNYSLKLIEDEALATSFSLKRIVENKSSQINVHFNQIIYISAYIKEKSQYYYLNTVDNSAPNTSTGYNGINTSNYKQKQTTLKTLTDNPIENLANSSDSSIFEVELTPHYINKFFVVNQYHFHNKYSNIIYPGDLVNIKFNINENCLLGVKTTRKISSVIYNLKEEAKEDISTFNADAIDDDFYHTKINKIKNSYDLLKTEGSSQVYPFTYTDSDIFYNYVNNNSFWVIEDDGRKMNKISKKPLVAGDTIRIKNAILNKYLAIELKNEGNFTFVLVDEEKLCANGFLFENFQINHYAINVEDPVLYTDCKIIIRAVMEDIHSLKEFSNEPNINFNIIQSNMKPISLSFIDNHLIVGTDDEFIFEIKKIPIQNGNESLYIKSVVNQLEIFVVNFALKYQKNSYIIDLIKKNLNFFTNYLMNQDISFYNPNLNTNCPVQYRQNLLNSYDILELIDKILKFFSPSKSGFRNTHLEITDKNRSINDHLKDLMKNILIFLIHLSESNHTLKEKIFLNNMKEILTIGNIIFENQSILIFFLFKVLQGCKDLKVKQITQVFLHLEPTNKIFSSVKTDAHAHGHIAKILLYISGSSKYYYFFKKALSLDKYLCKSTLR